MRCRAETEKTTQTSASKDTHKVPAPRFEECPEQLIVGLNETYTFETRLHIPTQWNRFVAYLGKVQGQIGKACYGVCWNYEPGCGFDYLTGVEAADSSSLPKEFTRIRLPAGRYAVFIHEDHVSQIPQSVEAIYSKWLPLSGFKIAESPSFENTAKHSILRPAEGASRFGFL